jgi:Glycosyl hydrolase family 79 C-terminal beta domain
MNGATKPGVTLQGTLMNHTNVVQILAPLINLSHSLANYHLPFILGEANNLFGEGAYGISDVFGAALWAVDFGLYAASQGIQRLHFHEGTNYRYVAWQPITTSKGTIGTRAPFYGHAAITAILGNILDSTVRVQALTFPDAAQHSTDAAYAIYHSGKLARVAVVNLREYNYTVPTPGGRSAVQYRFNVPSATSGHVPIQRLSANGSDALTGVSWNGLSYNYELKQGMPVRLNNVTVGEQAAVSDGVVSVIVPFSSAAVLVLG